MPRIEDEESGEQRADWMLGFEARDGSTVICIECGALTLNNATHASRHREWHVRNGG